MERALRTHQLRTPGEPISPRSPRLPGRSGRRGRRVTAAALAAGAALLATGLTASAEAATATTAKASAKPHAVTLPVCLTGYHNSFEFYTWCQGTSTAGFRTIAFCANGDAVLGVEYADGSGNMSYADCSATGGLNSTLNADWGVLECSASNGTGTFQGYIDSGGDISWILQNWGAGNITTGGTALCDYSIGQAAAINPNTPPN
jgi:hypothetical protein